MADGQTGQDTGQNGSLASPAKRKSLTERLCGRVAAQYARLTPGRALVLILIVGLLTRCLHLLRFSGDEPIVMGGLFLSFADAIAENGYLPPAHIPHYSEGGLPFLYPPLAFYLTAFLTHGLGLPPGWVINLLPIAFSVGALLIFYKFARYFLGNWRDAALAAFIFALLPNAVAEQVEAAGLAESLGSLLTIAFLLTLTELYLKPERRMAALSGLVLGLCVLSSPGGAMGATFTALFFAALFLTRHEAARDEKWKLLGIGAGVSVLVGSPYLVHVLMTGWGTFIEAFTYQMTEDSMSGQSAMGTAWSLFETFPLVNPQVFLWQALTLLGLLAAFSKARLKLTALWTLVIFILIPREGRWLVAPGVAVLAAGGLTLLYAEASRIAKNRDTVIAGGFVILVAGVCLMPWSTPLRAAFGAYDIFSRAASFREDTFAVYDWARTNTPENARFLIAMDEFSMELGAYKMQRTVINMHWGTEFQPAKWQQIQGANIALHTCLDTDTQCVAAAVQALDAKGPLYLIADNHWLRRTHGTPTLLQKLHTEGAVSLFSVDLETAKAIEVAEDGASRTAD